MKYIIFTIFLSFNSFASKKADKVVAEVNGEKIYKSKLEETYRQNLMVVRDKVVTKQKVLEDLINRQVGIQMAKKEKLQKNSVVKFKMEDILYHAKVSKDLEPRLKKIVVPEKDVKTYYKQFPEYRTAHILFRITANSTNKAEWQEAQKLALTVSADLKRVPEKFSELANKYSQTAAAPNGGDIGFQPAIRLAPEYFKAINGKSPGHITTPVRSQFGYHIIKVLAKKDFKDVNTTLYKKIVYDLKRDKILANYFQEIRKRAKIKILDKTLSSK